MRPRRTHPNRPLLSAPGVSRRALLAGGGALLAAPYLGSQDARAQGREITLPMSGGTDSLNVAVAAGVFLYHFCRVM